MQIYKRVCVCVHVGARAHTHKHSLLMIQKETVYQNSVKWLAGYVLSRTKKTLREVNEWSKHSNTSLMISWQNEFYMQVWGAFERVPPRPQERRNTKEFH